MFSQVKKNVLYISFSSTYMLFAGSLEWIFALHGSWFKANILAPPEWMYLTIWGIMFGLLAASFMALMAKEQRFSIVPLLYLLTGALCSLFSYLFFQVNNTSGALLLSALMLLIIFFIFRYSLDRCRLAAILLLPFVFWLAFLVNLMYFAALFGV